MDRLEREYKKALCQLKMFNKLQECRNMDFPNNLNFIYLKNFSWLTAYYKEKIYGNLDYSVRTDYTIRTLIYNFVVSVKAYINRKRIKIDTLVPSAYKDRVNSIVTKYWKAKRKETVLDKLIFIRDKFEHEEISGISIARFICNDHIEEQLLFDEINLIKLFKDSIIQLDEMNKEIEEYIKIELNKLNFSWNSMFMNAFYKRFKGKEYTRIYPEPTLEETNYFDNYIEKLTNEK